MTQALRLLVIDDSFDDVVLLIRALTKAGYEISHRHVWDAAAVRLAFEEPWEFVVSDWSMPAGFTGLAAFEIMRDMGLDLPFVIVSGTIGDELAVDALKAGVHDFITKGNLARLVPTIERELREAAVRRRQREADAQLEQQRRELVASERLLRDVVESVPDGVLVANQDDQIVMRNAAAMELLGLMPDESTFAQWRSHIELYDSEGQGFLAVQDRPLVRALEGHAVDRQIIMLRKSGQDAPVWLSASTRPLRDDRGVIGAVGVFRDVTGERAAQEQLMISDRMASIGMLAAGVAHEINNPLAAVLTNLELAAEGCGRLGGTEPVDVPEILEMLADARSAADRVRQIVKDLKIFSRHEDDVVGAIDLQQMLESTARMAWNEIRHRATLIKDFAATPRVRGTESRLGQVFLNLLVNAAHAIPEGSADRNSIRITTGIHSEDCVFVDVSDTGSGMSADTLRQLFTPFFTTKPQGEGTGLGLTIAHRIVTAIGGSIRVESVLGQGTTFRVVLPIAERQASHRSQAPTQAPPVRRARVLVIDDEPLITSVVRRILASEHDVYAETDARAALALLGKGEAFDVILCDLMMPVMAGMEFYARVVAEHPEHADRIVFMTGDAFTVAARSFLDEVSNQRIEKPFHTKFLRALISERTR